MSPVAASPAPTAPALEAPLPLAPNRGPAPARIHPRVLLRACRPRQWLKNVVLALAPASAGVLTKPGVVPELLAALVAFCLLSSATYLVNDVRDREEDRRHLRKRLRPVAAGQLAPGAALRAAIVLATAGILLSLVIRPVFAAVAAAYVLLTLTYSIWLRQVVVADILVVAAGFALRAAAGGAAVDVRLSRSFLLVTAACAVFLIAGKRYAEVTGRGRRAPTRPTLTRYSPRSLGGLVTVSASLGCLAYAHWAFARPTLGLWLPVSLIPFVLWLGRYATMLGRGGGEAPEELVLSDPVLLTLGVIWGALFLAGIYGAR